MRNVNLWKHESEPKVKWKREVAISFLDLETLSLTPPQQERSWFRSAKLSSTMKNPRLYLLLGVDMREMPVKHAVGAQKISQLNE